MAAKRLLLFPVICATFLLTAMDSLSQPGLGKDFNYMMEIPSVIAMESSPAHLYILSDSEGMVVFRTQPDSLLWLYSSSGMQQRGNIITADIRFAYLFGDSRRLTVLEPTSLLGVYSSTLLPERPLDARRLGNTLYVAMGPGGLGKLSLDSPSSVDSTVIPVERSRLQNERIIDLESSATQLFALAANRKLFVFRHADTGEQLDRELMLKQSLNRIFLVENQLMGTDQSGSIYEIDRDGELLKLGSIGEPVLQLEKWRGWLIIKGESNRIWTSFQGRMPVLWRKDGSSGNHFTVTGDEFWLNEYNKVSRIIELGAQPSVTESSPSKTSRGNLALKPIKNQIVPFPKPLLLTLEVENGYPFEELSFSYRSHIEEAEIRGRGFYWAPGAEDVGRHRFTIIATTSDGQVDSTSFNVEVRSFNAPPRFSPIRTMTIPVEEAFELPVKAKDPDGANEDLIRYMGVDLPEGASVNEKTGLFTWTPRARQIGENTFRVIATDQYGAASSIDITLRVVDIKSGDDSDQ